MSDSAQTLRQLKIKTGVVQRLIKEEQSDLSDVEERKQVLQGLKDKNADGADIRNAERVLKDAEQMIPRTRKSLDEALEALEDLVNGLASEESIKSSTEWQAAFSVLQQVEAGRKSDGN